MKLPEIRWPRSPYLLVLDHAGKTVRRYRGRDLVGSWDVENEEALTPGLVERVRKEGYQDPAPAGPTPGRA